MQLLQLGRIAEDLGQAFDEAWRERVERYHEDRTLIQVHLRHGRLDCVVLFLLGFERPQYDTIEENPEHYAFLGRHRLEHLVEFDSRNTVDEPLEATGIPCFQQRSVSFSQNSS